MTLRRRHGVARTGLDFTSLVDIALVLVVYFLLASQTAASRDLPVTLPQAGTGQQAATDTIELVVDRGGTVTFRGRTVELKELPALAGKSKRRVFEIFHSPRVKSRLARFGLVFFKVHMVLRKFLTRWTGFSG